MKLLNTYGINSNFKLEELPKDKNILKVGCFFFTVGELNKQDSGELVPLSKDGKSDIYGVVSITPLLLKLIRISSPFTKGSDFRMVFWSKKNGKYLQT